MDKLIIGIAAALAALITTPVRAQTDRPVQQTLPSPEVGRAGTVPLEPAPGTLACRANLVRLWVDIPPWERAGHWIFDLYGRDEAPAAELAARRRCLEMLDEPLVRFDGDLPPSPPPTG